MNPSATWQSFQDKVIRRQWPIISVFLIFVGAFGLVAAGFWRRGALLIGIGILGAAGQMMMTASLRYAPLSTVVAMDYSALIWSTLIGYIWWDHLPPNSTWLGAPIIVASSAYIFWRERRLSIERAAETAA